jgi:hypothetical protein
VASGATIVVIAETAILSAVFTSALVTAGRKRVIAVAGY